MKSVRKTINQLAKMSEKNNRANEILGIVVEDFPNLIFFPNTATKDEIEAYNDFIQASMPENKELIIGVV